MCLAATQFTYCTVQHPKAGDGYSVSVIKEYCKLATTGQISKRHYNKTKTKHFLEAVMGKKNDN